MVFPEYPINCNIWWICQVKIIRIHACKNWQVTPNCIKYSHYINIKYNCSNNFKLIRRVKTSANKSPEWNFIYNLFLHEISFRVGWINMSFIITNHVITNRSEVEIFTMWNFWNRIKIRKFKWSHLLTISHFY
jgi:hypothetical protein